MYEYARLLPLSLSLWLLKTLVLYRQASKSVDDRMGRAETGGVRRSGWFMTRVGTEYDAFDWKVILFV